jgi:hypothetical protein
LPNPSLGEGIGDPAYSDPPYEQVYNLDCNTCSESYELPHGWFVGENNDLHVNVVGGPVGIDWSTWDWIQGAGSGYAAFKGLSQVLKKAAPKGGPVGTVVGLTVSIVNDLQWDTFYFVGGGSAAPVPLDGVPEPP